MAIHRYDDKIVIILSKPNAGPETHVIIAKTVATKTASDSIAFKTFVHKQVQWSLYEGKKRK